MSPVRRVADPFKGPLEARDLPLLRQALSRTRGAVPARAVVEAARLGWQAGLEALHASGADVNASHRNYRPLHALIQEKPHEGGSSTPERVRCLEWLLAHGADPDLSGAWPLARAAIVAAFGGERSYVRVLTKGVRSPDVFVAAALGRARRVAALLAREPALATARDQGTLTALHCCAGSRLGRRDTRTARGLLDVVRMLLDAGADPAATARSWGHDVAVSYFAVRAGQRDVLDLLLDRGVDPTGALATAAWDRQFDLVDHLIARGARLDAATDHDRPLLNELVKWGQFAIARELLARGASPNIPDAGGWTALHYAASRGNRVMVTDLLAAGADPSVRDATGATPEDVARLKRQIAAARALLRSSASSGRFGRGPA